MLERCSLEKYEKNLSQLENFPFVKTAKDFYGIPLQKEEKEIALDKSFDVLVIYGISSVIYLQLEKWKGRLIFLEDEKEAFLSFLQTNIAEKILEDERVSVYFLEDYILKKIAWENVFLKIKFYPSHYYFCKKKEQFLELENKLTEMIFGALLSFSNYHDFGISSFENTFQNLLNLKNTRNILDLKNSFSGFPAIVCGAGPSLEKDLLVLKQMSDKALIFAGGSALSVLAKNDVAIHFSSAIDKKAEEKKNGFFETIFFHSLALSHNCLKKVHGEKILVGNDGLLLENFLFSGEKLDTGWTVATFLLSIAHFLGCSPIYFTGLDFCFSKKKYGGDVEGDEKYDIETEDIFGNKVFTQKDWILAVRWIEDFAKKASLVNANKAGLKIKNVKEGSFDLKKSFDFTGLIHSVVSPLKHIAMPKEEIQKKLNDIEKSALECLKIADFYLQDLEKDFQNGFFAQDYSLENFEKELFFGELLFPLWNTYSYVIKRKIKNEKNNLPEHFLVFLNKLLFFKNVINDYLTLGKKWKNMP